MANFQTHLIGGALVSSAGAFASFGNGLSNPGETQSLFAIGVVASLLPDIDADASKPVRGVFALAGIVVGFLVAFTFAGRFGLLELVLIWATLWLFVRYPLFWLFAHYTVHRGVWHSLLMALVLALTAAVVAERWLALSTLMAWLVGGFTLLGYLTHLVLDEVASVDLTGSRVKRSFGTALKPFSVDAWPASLLLFLALVGLLGITPDPAPILAAISGFGLDIRLVAALWPRWGA
jgi:membrane-bound metal-dependent hydrolase YbcI (DUF457 family)